jgi:transcription-repair coupling factor (superfamily II helicase)
LRGERIGVSRLDFGPQGGRVEFQEQAQADPAALIQLIQGNSKTYRMDGPRVLRILAEQESAAARFEESTLLLEKLSK